MNSFQKGSIFTGFKKARNGRIECMYLDPNFRNSMKFQKPINSIFQETDLHQRGKTDHKETRESDQGLDKKYSGSTLSRRGFIKTTGLGVIAGGFFSCDKEEKPIETVDPPIPLITGPTELTISRVGMSTSGNFDSLGTIGATDLFWQLIKPISFMDNIDQIGSDPSLNIHFSIPGENEVRLITDNSGGRTRLSQRVKVNPPKLPDKNYDLPVLLLMDEGGTQLRPAFYTLDIRTMELTRLFSGEKIYGDPTWEPSGQRFAFVSYPGPEKTHYPETPYKITTYNLISGTFKEISNNTSGLVWRPKWSPKGDWIAYLDDSKTLNNAVDVVALMRPDGSEQFYLDGSGQSLEYSGMNLSWDPEGTRLVAGGDPREVSKLSIYGNLFSRRSEIMRLPTEEQKERYYEAEAETFIKAGMPKDIFMYFFLAGTNGLAWSPDGAYIAYTANFGLNPEGFQAILLSRADGTGDIKTIARCPSGESWGADDEFWLPNTPTWSPNGLDIYFTAEVFNIPHLYKYNLETEHYSEINLPGYKPRIPTLYG